MLNTAQAQQYSYTDLNQSAVYSIARAINNSGKIVGDRYVAGNADAHATLWTSAGITDLGTFGGAYSSASAINSSGQIGGTSTLYDYYTVATVWTGSGAAQAPAGDAITGGLGINNSGKLAGWSVSPTGYPRATTWNGSTESYLATLGGNTSSAAGINNQGQYAGYSSLAGNDVLHATLWTDAGVTDLGTLGGNDSMAQAINDSGMVVGGSRLIDNGNMHATLWNNGSVTDLGSLGGDGGFAMAINSHGQIVGNSYSATFFAPRATLWDGSRVVDLNDFLDADSAAAGWVLTEANGINDNGSIVGAARNFNTGETHAYLLSISAVPEPASYAMLMLGLGLLLARRKMGQDASN